MEHLHCKVILLWCQQCRNPDLEVAFRCRKSWEGFWSVSAWISVRQKKSPTEIQSVRSSSSASSLLGADKGLKQTNFPFVPLLFFGGGKPQGCSLFHKPLCWPQKSNSLPGTQYQWSHTERDTAIDFRAMQAWLLPAIPQIKHPDYQNLSVLTHISKRRN